MTRTALSVALATVLATWGSHAVAAVSGHCTYEGNKHPLVDGVAWIVPPDEDDEPEDWDGDGEPDLPPPPDTLLAFATFKLDAGAIQRAADREDALRDQSFAQDDSAKLQLTLGPEAMITSQYLWISPGMNLSYSSNEVGKLEAKVAGKGRITGNYKYTDDDAEGPVCDVTFDLTVLGPQSAAPPMPGTPLPAGGGEPGKAYLALNKAMLAGDMDTLATLLPPEQVAEMRKAQGTPEFAAQLAFLQAMTPSTVRIKGGRIDGDKAWLEFDAEEGGTPRSGTVEMSKVGGRWKVDKESTRDRDK